ncbi:MAG TPA: hypothetical protein VJN18_32225 [Polyangiaceae bacterium]|nr:hypothetical protein [Polyangiaceae bacterium]
MKLRLMVEEVVTVATPKLCHWNCEHSETDYPVGQCNLFGGMRDASESEDVVAYLRLPECVAAVTEPYEPILPNVGDKVVMRNRKKTHTIGEVRAGRDEDSDDYYARLDPPSPYSGSGWVAERYLQRAEEPSEPPLAVVGVKRDPNAPKPRTARSWKEACELLGWHYTSDLRAEDENRERVQLINVIPVVGGDAASRLPCPCARCGKEATLAYAFENRGGTEVYCGYDCYRSAGGEK